MRCKNVMIFGSWLAGRVELGGQTQGLTKGLKITDTISKTGSAQSKSAPETGSCDRRL